MNIALLQVNPTVGDIAGNARLILEALRAASAAADPAATPELTKVTDRAFGTGWRMPIAARLT
jgi:predicted amidohydrolase